MTKRKSRKILPKKVRKVPPLDTEFNCPYCAYSKCIRVRMNRKDAIGMLKCSVCDAVYSCRITQLAEPVDVYSEWIDQCVEVNTREEERKRRKTRRAKLESDAAVVTTQETNGIPLENSQLDEPLNDESVRTRPSKRLCRPEGLFVD